MRSRWDDERTGGLAQRKREIDAGVSCEFCHSYFHWGGRGGWGVASSQPLANSGGVVCTTWNFQAENG